jgi:hypothetical protein
MNRPLNNFFQYLINSVRFFIRHAVLPCLPP